jgi:hypothetical protein
MALVRPRLRVDLGHNLELGFEKGTGTCERYRGFCWVSRGLLLSIGYSYTLERTFEWRDVDGFFLLEFWVCRSSLLLQLQIKVKFFGVTA